MNVTTDLRIIGENIFFNFIEVAYDKLDTKVDYVQKIKNHEIDGIVFTNVFTKEEIEAVKEDYLTIDSRLPIITPNGTIFPAPFSSVTGEDSTLSFYNEKLSEMQSFGNKLSIRLLLERMQLFFEHVACSSTVNVPHNKLQNKPIAAGTFRNFKPYCGGLFVHCGYFFQEQFQGFFSVLESDMALEEQLSYFLVLQNPEIGGELTIYDMLWRDVMRKEKFDDNNLVVNNLGEKIDVRKVRSFKIRPMPGDVLIFSGGPIWHRVEDIQGLTSRITFGGFVNFSANNDKIFYWS